MKIHKKIVMFIESLLCVVLMCHTAQAAYFGHTESVQNQIHLAEVGNGHRVSFQLNGGQWAEGFIPPENRELETELVLPTVEHITREGYAFMGWYLEEDFSGEVQTVCPITQKTGVVYYAKWRGNAYILRGVEFNEAVKTLANGTTTSYDTMDSVILDIQWAEAIPDGVETAIVSNTEKSDHLIKAYFESTSGTVYLVNVDDVPVYLDPDCSYMFHKFSAMTNVDMSRFIMEQVTDMSWMFCYCRGLINFSLTNLDTSNVTTLQCLFAYCSYLKTVDLSGWDTRKVENMSSMFVTCSVLERVNLDGWSGDSVKEMRSTFSQCYCLEDLDIGHWNTPNLEDLYYTFNGCGTFKNLDLSGWDTSKVTTMQRMFNECIQLSTLNISSWDTGNCTNMRNMFQNCYKLTEIRMDQYDMSAAASAKGGMMYRAARTTKACTVYCTEETETALLSGTSITSSYFTFVRPTSTASLTLYDAEAEEEIIQQQIASDSNADWEIATLSNAIENIASDSNAQAE